MKQPVAAPPPAPELIAEGFPDPNHAAPAPAPVTAVICTRNGEQYLADQLESILRQTVPVADIVLVDDASRDRSVSLATRILDDAGVRYRLYRNASPLGSSVNFHVAIGLANTEFVALADQDDRWHDDRVERQIAVFRERPDMLLVATDARLIDQLGAPLGESLFAALEVSTREWRELAGDNPMTTLIRRNIIASTTIMMRPSLAADAGPAPLPWLHDEWYAMAAAIAGRIAVSRDALTDYRHHGARHHSKRLPDQGRSSLRNKVEHVTGQGFRAQAHAVARAEALLDNVGRLRATSSQRALIGRKVSHERARLTLPESRLKRWPAVVRWGLKRRYSLYSRGPIEMARDLFQSQADRTDGGAPRA